MHFLKYMIAASLLIVAFAIAYPLAIRLFENPSLSWGEEELLTGFFGLLMLVVGIGIFVSLHRHTAGLVTDKTLSRLRQKGRPAQATVLELEDTGMTVNDDPVVQVLLLIHDSDKPPYQVKMKQLVSRLAVQQLADGNTVEVLIDPENPLIVALHIE